MVARLGVEMQNTNILGGLEGMTARVTGSGVPVGDFKGCLSCLSARSMRRRQVFFTDH